MPETSIIIVSYNGLHETTAPCLESIFAHGAAGDFVVIVVDNGSSDGTPDYLAAMTEREPRLKCVFNGTNRGFAGGNNDGVSISTGQYIIFLNSDCLVTKGWIEGLIAPLSQDPSIGLVGPVSNSVGNEQQIFTVGHSAEEMIQEGMAWVSNSLSASFETQMLGFFCVAVRRDVIDKVGLLDEDFGLGFHEDDDYCIRARKAGYRLVCVEDVFVWHRGSGSFGRMGKRTGEIMRENRKKLEKKHDLSFAPIHPRLKHLRVIEGYLSQAPDGPLCPELLYRISNRIREIESRMPRGLIKKWVLSRRLASLRQRLRR